MRSEKTRSCQASWAIFLFQSKGTDLYALSASPEGDGIPRVNGSPKWCFRAELAESDFTAGSDAAGLSDLVDQVRRRGFCIFRAEEVTVH